mmetsp:Transcript_3566/g.10750  ORF Transcript_3566/g.10750 Transcript_3566/m.10750 type:complete len:85 (+) Transcript_3566:127-381(+)
MCDSMGLEERLRNAEKATAVLAAHMTSLEARIDAPQEKTDAESAKEIAALRDENAKLKYRIKVLIRALEAEENRHARDNTEGSE